MVFSIPAARRGVSLGVFMVALGSVSTAVSIDQASAASTATQNTVHVDIPAGSLASVLRQFATATGTKLEYSSPSVQGLTSPGLHGDFSVQGGFSQILGSHGLTVQQGRPGYFVVVKASSAIMLGPVRVGGTIQNPVPTTAMIDNLPSVLPGGEVASGGQLGMLGNRNVMDTPFNTTSYTSGFIESRQVRTVRDALKDDPSVRSSYATGTPSDDHIMLRGFDVGSGDTSFGGLYGMMSPTSIMTELAERVEIVRGPAALLNGMAPGGAIGGTINIVPKRAAEKPLSRIEADYTSNSQFGGHADVGRRFGKEKEFGIRLNGMIRSGNTPISRNSMKTALVGVGLDQRFEHIRFSEDFGYQYRQINGIYPYYSLDNNVSLPDVSRVRRSLNTPWAFLNTQDIFGVFRGEVDLFKNFTAYGSVGVHDYTNKGVYPTSVDISDQYGNATPHWLAAQNFAERYLTAEIGVRGKISTGPVQQELGLTANRYWNTEGFYREYASSYDYTTNIYSPSMLPRPEVSIGKPKHDAISILSSIGFADTLSALNKRIEVTAGLRAQRVQSENYDTNTGSMTSDYNRTTISPAVMAIFKPLKNLSIYGNWIQGLQQGDIVSTDYANAGQVFAPYKSTQYELGIKYSVGRFLATFDVFQISQPSTIVDVRRNLFELNGEQRNRGLELNLAGELIHGLHAVGGLMLIDPRLTKTQDGANNEWKAAGVSTVNFNMGLSYDVTWVPGLSLNTDIIYTRSEYISTDTPRVKIPGWVRLDMGIRYITRNPATKDGKLTFIFNVDNITNDRYWNSTGGSSSSLSLGAPRTARFSVAADF